MVVWLIGFFSKELLLLQGTPGAASYIDDSFVTANTVDASEGVFDHVASTPSYVLPSDNESEAESEPVVNLQSFSKEELFQRFRATERTAVKYKNKYKQVISWRKFIKEPL